MNERLIKLRKELGLTTRVFGEKINVSASTITNLEKGTRNITDRTISDICREFNVNETWLRTGEGEMFCEISEDEELMRIMAMATKIENKELRDALLLLPKLTDDQLIFLSELIKKLKG